MTMKNHFLKISERLAKKLGININYWVVGSFWTSIPFFLEAAINFIIIILFTQFLSQEMLGQYRFWFSVYSIISLCSLPGISTAIIQSISKKKNYRVIKDGTATMIKFSFLGSLAFIACAAYLYFTGRSEIYMYFLVSAFLFPFALPFRTYASYLLGKEDFARFSRYSTIEVVLNGAIFLLVILGTKNLLAIVIAFLSSRIITSGIFYWIVTRRSAEEIKNSEKDNNLTHYGINMTAIDSFQVIAGHIDKIILTYFGGYVVLALYTIAQTLTQPIKIILRPSLKLILPRLSRMKEKQKTFALIKKKMWLPVLISIGIATIGILVAPFLVDFLFPAEYESSIVYAQILFIAHIFFLPIIILNNYLVSIKATKSLYAANILPTIIFIISLIILLPTQGIWGVIISEFVKNIVSIAQLYYLSAREAQKN
jgi:O-antigen/teichoic acid export membrane protein